MSTDAKAIGARIRLMAGDNLTAFADKYGVPYRSLLRYIQGDTEPPPSLLAHLCARTGTSAHWLLTGEGAMDAASLGIRPAPSWYDALDEGGQAMIRFLVKCYTDVPPEERLYFQGYIDAVMMHLNEIIIKKRRAAEEDGGSRPKAARGRK
jgi:hypothetical protein